MKVIKKLSVCLVLILVASLFFACSPRRQGQTSFTYDELMEKFEGEIERGATNDFSQNVAYGSVSISTNFESFDKTTVTGAIEYIIAKVHEMSPNTKVVLYTCPLNFDWGKYVEYGQYIQTTVSELSNKWGNTLEVLDLYNAKYTQISAYMQSDGLHPTKMGYAQLFVPNFISLVLDNL